MVTSDSSGIIKNSLHQRRGRQRSAGKINLSNILGEKGSEPRAGNVAVGGASLALPAMHSDSVTSRGWGGLILFDCLCQQQAVESEGSLVH